MVAPSNVNSEKKHSVPFFSKQTSFRTPILNTAFLNEHMWPPFESENWNVCFELVSNEHNNLGGCIKFFLNR